MLYIIRILIFASYALLICGVISTCYFEYESAQEDAQEDPELRRKMKFTALWSFLGPFILVIILTIIGALIQNTP